jgi:hypothetical protein
MESRQTSPGAVRHTGSVGFWGDLERDIVGLCGGRGGEWLGDQVDDGRGPGR